MTLICLSHSLLLLHSLFPYIIFSLYILIRFKCTLLRRSVSLSRWLRVCVGRLQPFQWNPPLKGKVQLWQRVCVIECLHVSYWVYDVCPPLCVHACVCVSRPISEGLIDRLKDSVCRCSASLAQVLESVCVHDFVCVCACVYSQYLPETVHPRNMTELVVSGELIVPSTGCNRWR